jgi:hypothetical protein
MTSLSLEYAAAGVVTDPWDKTPRLEVTYFNGQEVRFRPSAINLTFAHGVPNRSSTRPPLSFRLPSKTRQKV